MVSGEKKIAGLEKTTSGMYALELMRFTNIYSSPASKKYDDMLDVWHATIAHVDRCTMK